MVTKLLLIRHGETKWNALGKFQGCTDIELSDAGIEQAEYLKKSIEDSFDVVYTSPLMRAKKTAEVICDGTDIKPIVADNIREINFGEWEGLTIKEIAELYPEEFKKWRTDDIDAPICGGDKSIKLACERAKNCVEKIIDENRGKTIAIVAHGGIIKATLIGLFGWNMSMYQKITLGNTAITEIRIKDNNNVMLTRLNDTSHLPKDMEIKSYV